MLTKPWRARKTSRAISEGAKAAAIDVAATHTHPRTKKILFPHTSPSFPHNLEFRVKCSLADFQMAVVSGCFPDPPS